jgi:hypothetical protein
MKQSPVYHGILLTRDDEDIISQCIAHALTWCDQLYVFETGGFDRTWDIIVEWSRKDPRISCFQNEGGQALMESGLRGYVFERYRHRMRAGDWVVQVDSDEFYHVAPPEFVERSVRKCETAVYNSTYEFRLTRGEVEGWLAGREGVADRKRPIHERRRFYTLLRHAEPRMFRYRPSMQWPPFVAYPYNAGFVARARIPIRHYPHRDPLQLARRWVLRKTLADQADPNWRHWQLDSWRDLVAADDDCELRYWKAQAALPGDESVHHLAPFPKRAVQRLLHSGVMLRLDRCRPKFPADWRPKQLGAEVVRSIAVGYADADRTSGWSGPSRHS